MSTEKSNGGPFVTFREECEILRARVVELEAQLAERDRSVVKANEQAERFEREWYLRGDELDEAKKLLLLAKDALEKVREVTGSNTFAHNYADEALAAINDSKLVEGMILCDVEPVSIVLQQMKRIAELEQQNLELLAAIEAVQIDAEECLDFDNAQRCWFQSTRTMRL